MAVESDLQRLSYLSPTLFGTVVTKGESSFNGIFDNEYSADLNVSGTIPMLTMRTIDTAGFNQGDTLSVNSTEYNIVEIMPDGTGMSMIRLESG
jgi:hypothetical protein